MVEWFFLYSMGILPDELISKFFGKRGRKERERVLSNMGMKIWEILLNFIGWNLIIFTIYFT